MKTNRLAAAASTAVMSLAILVACSPESGVAPARARIMGAGFDLLGNPNAGQAQVCKTGNAGSFTATFDAASATTSFSASQVNTGAGALTATATPGQYTFSLAAGQCVIIYTRPTTGATSDPNVSVNIVEAAGPTLNSVTVSAPDVGGPTNSASLATRSARLNFNMFHDAIATFNNAPPVVAAEGCSPGYYKNHVQPSSNSTFASLGFVNANGASVNVTLATALNYGGGPALADKERLLLRQAAAAYMNSVRLSPAYPLTTAQVIAQVNAALASDNTTTIGNLQSQLDDYNNIEGPRC